MQISTQAVEEERNSDELNLLSSISIVCTKVLWYDTSFIRAENARYMVFQPACMCHRSIRRFGYLCSLVSDTSDIRHEDETVI